MAALDLNVFRSKQFVFVVGQNQTTFTVHADIMAKQSKALDVLINGPMREASEGKAIFEDVEEDTFIRICQFAYTGEYATPDFTRVPTIEVPQGASTARRRRSKNFRLRSLSPLPSPSAREAALIEDSEPEDPVPEEPAPAPEEPAPVPEEPALEEPVPEEPAVDFSWVKGSKKAAKPKKPSKISLLRQSLHGKLYSRWGARLSLEAKWEVRENSDPQEDYTTVFLGHAQLYVFAEKWGIKSLKELALYKLHRTLTTFTLYAARRPDIVELLRYAFSNNHTPDLVDDVDELRSLVMLYTTCEVESLIKCPEFLSLLGEGGQLAQSLVQMLLKRID